MADPASSRQEKSLGLLTSKFVNLLQDAEDGILDIKSVSFFVDFFVTVILLKVFERRSLFKADMPQIYYKMSHGVLRTYWRLPLALL